MILHYLQMKFHGTVKVEELSIGMIFMFLYSLVFLFVLGIEY